MTEAPKRTPRPIAGGREAKSFPLSPTDGFVLSRVDGTLDEEDLAQSTGLPEAQVRASLAKLESMGLIKFESGPPPRLSGSMAAVRASSVNLRAASPTPSSPPPRVTPEPTPQRHVTPAKPTPEPQAAAPLRQTPKPLPAARPLSAEEQATLVEDVDLEADLRRRILDAFRDLDQRDHYTLLGVDPGADKKIIKRAYFEHAAAFHPDRYFRKRLGSFKVRMEAVFARLTIAHDTLADKENRAAYDAYLGEQRISQAIEEHLARGLAEAKQAQAIVESQVLEEEKLTAPIPPPPTASPQVDVAARREALARRLLGGNRPPSAPSVGAINAGRTGPTAPTHAQTQDAVGALKRRYEERVNRAKSREAQKFASQAETALAAGEAVKAANLFRIAADLNNADAELERKASESRQKADTLLADTYMRQGRYEESQNQWPEAARSWSRVCKASPNNATAHERAANAAVKAGGELREGLRLGQRACELEPKNALFRITLATCYSAAGMTLNARRELDTAAQLAPHDDTIRSMIKRVGQPA